MGLPSASRRPRRRKPRGRGLRTTNGCITCRKRHLKCDETKPICGPCIKKGKACEYTNLGRASDIAPASNRPMNEVVPAPARQQSTSPERNQEYASRDYYDANIVSNEPHGVTDAAWTAAQTDINAPQPALLQQLPESNPVSSPSSLAWQQSYLSPSNASFAAVRWFGLLASDAARDCTIPNFQPDESLWPEFPTTDVSSLQRATQVLDSTPNSHTSHGPTEIGTPGGTLREDQIWQSRKPIELSPTEQILFEHFLHQVSPWIDLFDPTNQFATFVAHLAVSQKEYDITEEFYSQKTEGKFSGAQCRASKCYNGSRTSASCLES
ncbi:hypothetical protein Plec18170_002624 [Paecilomyces lecythidis]